MRGRIGWEALTEEGSVCVGELVNEPELRDSMLEVAHRVGGRVR